MKKVRIGLLGCGAVGSAFCSLVKDKKKLFLDRDGLDLEISVIGVADPDKPRNDCVPRNAIVKGWQPVTTSKDLDIVVELIGGVSEAREAVFNALEMKHPIVTANKALLAAEGTALTQLAKDHNVGIGFEASVGCGIPVVSSISETLNTNEFQKFIGIVNGTTNYILSQMTDHKISYDAALKRAQDQGFAEADPTFDVQGRDSAQKLSILSALAFGVAIPDGEIFTEGISKITEEEIRLVAEFGYVIKLLAIGHRSSHGVELRVHPALVSVNHPLAGVRDEYNAFFLTGDVTGEVMLYGRGAGPIPTAGAVLSDVARLARHGTSLGSTRRWAYDDLEHIPIGDIETDYYLIFPVLDTPGVIGRITSVLGSYGINIESAHAHLPSPRNGRGIVQIICQRAKERDVRSAISAVRDLPVLNGETRFFRIEVMNRP